MAMQAFAVPTVKRHHHGLHAGSDGGFVSGSMNVTQALLVNQRVAPINAFFRATITDKMFGGGDPAGAL